MAIWQGRLSGEVDERLNELNASIPFDSKMYKEDILGSVAHATMLGKIGILSEEESLLLTNELKKISSEIENGTLEIDKTMEDIHTFVEAEVTKRLGDLGKKLHTARSRNDQVALDDRLYVRTQTLIIKDLVKNLINTLVEVSKQHTETIMPGYTHLQRAQPITLAHHLMAYAQMFARDVERINDAMKRIEIMPLGSGALAGTTYPLDRQFVCDFLNFQKVSENSIDGVSDRDFLIELANIISVIMMHMSRFSEEIILWSSWEFKYVTLADKFTTGSSIMPQKKNSDLAELVRGKTGRVYGNEFTLLTLLKGLPLAYNKDMQEDKEAIFDSIETVIKSLVVFEPMIQTAVFHPENMAKAASEGFINATDCADYLVNKGIPFRDAYKITGALVNKCIESGHTLDNLPMEEYKALSDVFEKDIYDNIDLLNCVMKRTVYGGPSPKAVKVQIENMEKLLSNI